jgi:hypothetical protein
LIQTFLDVYYGYPLCQKPPRLLTRTTSILLDSLDDALENLLSGTTSVLLESLDDALENPRVRPLPRKVEI